jgi:Lrp/AsnC family transcriptional regulator, leucine-responsive regulatory protein
MDVLNPVHLAFKKSLLYDFAMFSKAELLDDLDLQILNTLQTEARVSYAELSKRFGLSAPAITERVRKLEETGYILGYQARLNPLLLEQGLLAFVALELGKLTERKALLQVVANHRAILECHHTTGSDDFLLKVRVRDTTELELLLSEALKKAAPSLRTHTTIALSSLKENSVQVRL